VIDKLEQTTAVYEYQKEQMGWDTINPVWITGGRSELILRLAHACSLDGNGGLLMKLPSAGARYKGPHVPALENRHMSKSKILFCRPHRHMKGTFEHHAVRLDVTRRLGTEGANSSRLQTYSGRVA
jgi:hypothetical protein